MKINNITVRWIGQSVSKSLGMIVFFFGTVSASHRDKGNYTESLAYFKDAQQLETSSFSDFRHHACPLLSNVFFPAFAEEHNSQLLSLSVIDGDTTVFDRAR
jgi:hypothetical protein